VNQLIFFWFCGFFDVDYLIGLKLWLIDNLRPIWDILASVNEYLYFAK